jgi:hypothetical protein
LSRQKTTADAIGHWAEAQIKARGLKLALLERYLRGAKPAFLCGALEPLNR